MSIQITLRSCVKLIQEDLKLLWI